MSHGRKERGVHANLPCQEHAAPRLWLPPAPRRCRAEPGLGMPAELLALPLTWGKAPVIPLCRTPSLLLRFRCLVCFSFNLSMAGTLVGTCTPELPVDGCACWSPAGMVLCGSGSVAPHAGHWPREGKEEQGTHVPARQLLPEARGCPCDWGQTLWVPLCCCSPGQVRAFDCPMTT